jgi:hypothetical protein
MLRWERQHLYSKVLNRNLTLFISRKKFRILLFLAFWASHPTPRWSIYLNWGFSTSPRLNVPGGSPWLNFQVGSCMTSLHPLHLTVSQMTPWMWRCQTTSFGDSAPVIWYPRVCTFLINTISGLYWISLLTIVQHPRQQSICIATWTRTSICSSSHIQQRTPMRPW